jgi:hypothetical protein
VTNTTGLDFNPNLTGTRLGDFAFNDFKRPAGAGDLGSTHLGHKIFGLNPHRDDAENLTHFYPMTTGNISSSHFRWKTSSSSFALTLIFSPGLNSLASSFVANGSQN